MAICAVKDCGKKATWQIHFQLWSTITPPSKRHSRNCLRMMSSLVVCDGCRDDNSMESDTIFSAPEGRARILAVLDKLNQAPPDLDHPGVLYEPIIDEPQDIQQMARDAERSGRIVHKG